MSTQTAPIKSREINVERRSIYGAYGRGKRVTYDAHGTLRGVEYRVTAPSKPEAVRLAIAEIEYVAAAGEFSAGGCRVACIGFEAWAFTMPGWLGSFCFGAVDLDAAIKRAAEAYSDHPDAGEFCRAAGRQ